MFLGGCRHAYRRAWGPRSDSAVNSSTIVDDSHNERPPAPAKRVRIHVASAKIAASPRFALLIGRDFDLRSGVHPHGRTCPSRTSTLDLVDENRNVIDFFFKHFFMTRAMPILHHWDATGRANRSNGLAEGHNGILTSVHPDSTLCRPGLSSKLPLRGDDNA